MGINNGKQKNIIRKNGIVLLLIFSIVFVCFCNRRPE